MIAGAGPTGLVLALWLTRLGVRVRIVDKTAEPGTTSRALAVQARTLEYYRQAGFTDAVVGGGVKILNVNLWVKGHRVARVPIGEIGKGLSRYAFALIFPQDAHERVLIEQLSRLGVEVERRTELASFEEHGGGVRSVLKRPDGSEEVCEAAYLAGCDGASSTVRRGLGIGFPGGTYSGLFYVADVEAAGPVTDHQLHADLDGADFLIVFPMKGDGRVRLVGTVKEVPGGVEKGLTFDDVRGRAVEQLKVDVARVNWFSTYRVHHRVADRFQHGRAFLLGDAAHVHSPVGGQGMNTGIGDAVNLAWKLAGVLNKNADEGLLDTYEFERIAFARRLVETTDRAFTIVVSEGGMARFVRTRLVPLLMPTLFRVPPLRRFAFRTLSQTVVNYRASPLSVGAAGTVRAGDRLPWVEIAAGEDNFAPLASMEWQVHVYGEAAPRVREVCQELGVALHCFSWSAAFGHAGLCRGAVYLLRPDGYVGFAASGADVGMLRGYVAGKGLGARIGSAPVAARAPRQDPDGDQHRE
jgi:2-polyprenyl-6-methoxyphenol hydroxylase-like FAD-dependent oxidoreductase